MYLILFKNSKGLYTKTSRHGYLYPDKSCRNSVESGVVFCTDINMKGSYGFIQCHMIKNTGSLLDAIKSGAISLHDALSIPMIYSVNGVEFWHTGKITSKSTVCYSYINNEVIEVECDLVNIEQSMSISELEAYHTYGYLLSYILEHNIVTSSNRDILVENIVRCLTGQEKEIGLCDNVVKIDRLKGYYTHHIYYYIFDGVSLRFLNSSDESLISKLEKLKYVSIKKEIKDICISHSLTFNFTDSDWDFREYSVSVFNQDITRLFLSNKRFSFSTYDMYKDILELSKNEVEDFRKKALKQASKSNLKEILKLGFKCALGDF